MSAYTEILRFQQFFVANSNSSNSSCLSLTHSLSHPVSKQLICDSEIQLYSNKVANALVSDELLELLEWLFATKKFKLNPACGVEGGLRKRISTINVLKISNFSKTNLFATSGFPTLFFMVRSWLCVV